MNELFRCENLTKRFGSHTALNNINLTLTRGKIIGLLGPNGSGKTTLIKLINGILVPTSGKLYINGLEPGTETKRFISYLPDNNFLNDRMSVGQILKMFSDFFEDFRKDLALKMLDDLGIHPNQKLITLSKGNREKVSLILTMSRNAQFYVLDEPIAGVDPATRDYVISTIINNYNPDASVVISTHLIADIEQVLDEAIFIKDGNIVMHDSVDNLRAENGKSVDELFREVFKW